MNSKSALSLFCYDINNKYKKEVLAQVLKQFTLEKVSFSTPEGKVPSKGSVLIRE